MKASVLTLAMCLVAGSGAYAQLADVSTPTPLLKGVHSELYNPILSADGQRLLFSNQDFSNLRMYDFRDNVTVSVSPAARSGLNAQFTPDGSEVIYVTQVKGDDGLNWRRVCSYDVTRGANKELSALARSVERPVVSAVAGEGLEINAEGRRNAVGRRVSTGVTTRGSQLIIVRNGVEKAYTPVPSYAGYTWASLSPDGKKVMFVAAGHGVVITDLEGRILSEPGNYESPVWYGNDHIIVMDATDDGHQMRSSRILLMTADGKTTQALTRPESMSMFPTASIEAGKVVYNTIDGKLYQMNVTLK